MKKGIIKGICKAIMQEVEKEYVGYEMGCLISAEFTPAPDYRGVYKKALALCSKYGVTFKGFMKQIKEWGIEFESKAYKACPYIHRFNLYMETFHAVQDGKGNMQQECIS